MNTQNFTIRVKGLVWRIQGAEWRVEALGCTVGNKV